MVGCAHSKGALGWCYVFGLGVARDAARGIALRGGGQLLWAVCGWMVLHVWTGRRCAGLCRGCATLSPCRGSGACRRSVQLGRHVLRKSRCCEGQSRGYPILPPRRRAGVCIRSKKFGAIGRVAVTPPAVPRSAYRRARFAAAARSPAQIECTLARKQRGAMAIAVLSV
jgi:hypothetical protein